MDLLDKKIVNQIATLVTAANLEESIQGQAAGVMLYSDLGVEKAADAARKYNAALDQLGDRKVSCDVLARECGLELGGGATMQLNTRRTCTIEQWLKSELYDVPTGTKANYAHAGVLTGS